MNLREEQLMRVLLGPCISEKATNVGEHHHRQVVFKVRKDAHKHTIKLAVEFLFKVDVTAVRVLNVKPKQKRFGKIEGYRKAWKKAYVSLAPGCDIDFMGVE